MARTAKITTIRLSAELMDKLRQAAGERGYPIKDLILIIIYKKLKNGFRHCAGFPNKQDT